MLVLSRRTGESVTIGADVTLTVLEVRGDVIRLGIDAPRTVPVHRTEILLELAEKNLDSASPAEEAIAALSQEILARPDQPA